jgi:hypothetical protein
MQFGTNGTTRVTIAATGATTFTGAIGVNGATPQAQITGWGTPTNPAVQSNYSGSAATLAQTSAAVAEIIVALKQLGIFGA